MVLTSPGPLWKTDCSKHHVAFNPVETYLHTMQGHIENFVKQVIKVHSRCIFKHAHLPARFWSATTTIYVASVQHHDHSQDHIGVGPFHGGSATLAAL